MTSIDLPGSWRHDDHPGRKKYRLRDRVRDKNDGFLCLAPKFQQLLVEVIPGDLIQGAERLIHQQQFGLNAERPSDGDTLLHSPR